MLYSIFGYLFLVFGLLILALPLILVELSRPRDWLIGGLFLFLGVFLLVENDFLRGSLNLFVISLSILNGLMIFEISQNRWFQLSFAEKKRIGSFDRWFESIRQIGQVLTQIGKGFLTIFKDFSFKYEKPSKEKKWVRSDTNEEIKNKAGEQFDSTDSKKIRNQELTENEETS